MAIGRNGAAARQMSVALNLGAAGGLTDGQLLERFVNRTGEAAELAFGCLVERHGRMVFCVCRSVLRDEHQAHDAFQATFLVLVKKARSLRVADSLAPWLHSVSYRVSLHARAAAIRRQKHERRHAETVPISLEPDRDRFEIGPVLLEEIEALPERFRVPIVMCDLEGRSHEDVARSLGWPVGTVKSRQARGRDRLRGRLARRGLAPALGSGAFFASQAQASTLPLSLARQTAASAARFALPAKASGVGAASARVVSLTKEFLMSLLLGKLKAVAIVGLMATLAVAGIVELGSKARGAPQGAGAATAPGSKTARLEVVPVPRGPGKIYLGIDKGLVAIDPTTGEDSRILIECKRRPRISPDGRLIAFEWNDAIWVRELEKLEELRKVVSLADLPVANAPAVWAQPVWSADSKKLILSPSNHEKAGHWRFRTFRINIDGTGREELPLPPEDGVNDWSPDGWLLTQSSRNAEIGWQLYVMKPDGSEQKQITKGGNPFYARFSPDGRRVLDTDGTTEERRGIWVVNRDGEGRRKILALPQIFEASACWSPDGKQIAVIDFARPQGNGKNKGRLIILDVDGDSQVEFPLDESLQLSDMPDWR